MRDDVSFVDPQYEAIRGSLSEEERARYGIPWDPNVTDVINTRRHVPVQ